MSEIEQPRLVLNIPRPENSTDPEVGEALSWYKERLALLPEMKVEKAPLTDGQKWTTEMTPDGQVNSIKGAHFSLEGVHITTPSFSWNQPLLRQRAENAKGADGEDLDISGIVFLLKDNKGRYLINVVNEPGNRRVDYEGKELHPSVRTPIQSSVQKLKDLAEGKGQVDPVLRDVLSAMTTSDRDLAAIVKDLILSSTPTDGNRIISEVYYGLIDVNDSTAQALVEKTGGKFLTRKQINAIDAVSGHTHIALSKAS